MRHCAGDINRGSTVTDVQMLMLTPHLLVHRRVCACHTVTPAVDRFAILSSVCNIPSCGSRGRAAAFASCLLRDRYLFAAWVCGSRRSGPRSAVCERPGGGGRRRRGRADRRRGRSCRRRAAGGPHRSRGRGRQRRACATCAPLPTLPPSALLYLFKAAYGGVARWQPQ